jgi:hypothetical protein
MCLMTIDSLMLSVSKHERLGARPHFLSPSGAACIRVDRRLGAFIQ